jgi:hypothetical protein
VNDYVRTDQAPPFFVKHDAQASAFEDVGHDTLACASCLDRRATSFWLAFFTAPVRWVVADGDDH